MEILKLERLKLPSSQSSITNLFNEICLATGTQIQLEPGCKDAEHRRDPFIRIDGSEAAVKKAKVMLLDKMEIMCNRIVLKMDISHFEHPSLIGKGGMLIKKVMDATNCHIHFPDSNKNVGAEKSNQVSIYGEPVNVERARVMLRALLPVQIYFRVSPESPSYIGLKKICEDVKLLTNYNGLWVYTGLRDQEPTVIIRCNQDQFPNEKKKIIQLMESLSSSNAANLPLVHMQVEIQQYYQKFVKGNNADGIMRRTGANISFPETNASRSDRNTIIISGSLDCVFMAWQEVMNYLPISVSFDVNETREIQGDYLNFLKDCGVTVSDRPKAKYYIKSVTVQGCEKFSKQMIQYRQHLLRLSSLNFSTDIDEMNLASDFISSLTAYFINPMSSNIPQAVLNVIKNSRQNDDFLMSSNGKWMPSSCIQNVQYKNGMLTNSDTILNMKNLKKSSLDQPPFLVRKESKGLLDHNITLDENVNYNFIESSSEEVSPVGSHQEKDTHDIFTNISSFSEDYYLKKALAARAMRRPINSTDSTQVPSSTWSGYGFSQSMPAAIIKKKIDAANHSRPFSLDEDFSFGESDESDDLENQIIKACRDGNIWSNKKESFSHSNYFDLLRNIKVPLNCAPKDALRELLWQNGLYKYYDAFTKEEIDYDLFLTLTERDLLLIGIPPEARRIMMLLKNGLRDESKKDAKLFEAAPGAGRK